MRNADWSNAGDKHNEGVFGPVEALARKRTTAFTGRTPTTLKISRGLLEAVSEYETKMVYWLSDLHRLAEPFEMAEGTVRDSRRFVTEKGKVGWVCLRTKVGD